MYHIPNYGGFMTFYKLPALQSQGVKIILHCFDNGRGQQPELNKYCERVYYYPRNTGHKGFTFFCLTLFPAGTTKRFYKIFFKDEYPIFYGGYTLHLPCNRSSF